jgi:hypothetical protein
MTAPSMTVSPSLTSSGGSRSSPGCATRAVIEAVLVISVSFDEA